MLQATLKNIADLPGPRGLPVVGNMFQLTRSSLHRDIEAWNREFGPYFKMRFGKRTLLGTSDHEALMAVMRDRPEGFRRTKLMEVIGLEMGITPGLFAANGDAWKRQRRMVMAGFDPGHVREYFPSLLKVTQRLRARWQAPAASGAAIDLQPELMRFTVDAIAGLAFGSDINTLQSDDDVIQQHLDKIFPALARRLFAIVPVWRWWKSAADRQLERSVEAVNVAIAGFIAAARARLVADPARRVAPPNLLESMIVSADEGDSGVTDRDVAGNVLTMLLAGEDTTANTLAWMLWLLHKNPEAMQRVQNEVRALGADSAGFTVDQMASLDYLEACAHETMRLKPVAPFHVFEALRDSDVGGVRVPAGTGIWCVMRGDSLTEKYFPDPHAFKPERWMSDGTSAQAASSAKRVSMPFGGGPRVCPGRYLALLEMKMAMSMLLTHFDIESVGTADGSEPQELMSFTMTPVGLQMRLRPRG